MVDKKNNTVVVASNAESTMADLRNFISSISNSIDNGTTFPIILPKRYRDAIAQFYKGDFYDISILASYEFDAYNNRNNIINLFKVGNFVSFFTDLYSLSVNLYLNVIKFATDIMYLFKTKNSHMQLKYNNKIIFQNSVGLYGFRKKQKMSRYAKRILSKKFINFFSRVIFEYNDRVNIILKGFRKQYKQSIKYLMSNLKYRLRNRHKKHSDYYKLLLKKRTLARSKGFGGRSIITNNGQRITEREILYDQINSKLYSFLYIRCFYVGSFQHGGIRIRTKNELPNKFY